MASKKDKKRKIRGNDTCLIVLDKSPGPEHLEISGNKLPTRKQCLLSYLAHLDNLRSEGSKNHSYKREALNLVATRVRTHYENADIPIISPKNVCKKIEELYNRNRNYTRTKIDSETTRKNISSLKEDLTRTMPFWPQDVMELMENRKKNLKDQDRIKVIDEDMKFLSIMMNDRAAHYAYVDTITAQKKEKDQDKIVKLNNRKQKEIERLNEDKFLKGNEIDEVLANSEIEYDADDSENFNHLEGPKRKLRRCVKSGQTLFIPPDALNNPLLASTELRNKVSSSVISSWFHDFIVSIGGDPSKFCLSYSSIYRLVTN